MVYMTEVDFMKYIKTHQATKYHQFDIPYGEINTYIKWESFLKFTIVMNDDSFEGAVQILNSTCRNNKIDNIVRNIRRK